MRESWNWLPSSRGHELSWSENIWWYAIYKTWNLSKHPGRFEDPNDYKGVHLTSEKCKFREWTWHILAAQVRTLWNWARNIWLWIKSCAKSPAFSSKLPQKPSILLNHWKHWYEILLNRGICKIQSPRWLWTMESEELFLNSWNWRWPRIFHIAHFAHFSISVQNLLQLKAITIIHKTFLTHT